jgi:hypothetical protein
LKRSVSLFCYLVYLLCLVCLVEQDQLDEQSKPDEPDKQEQPVCSQGVKEGYAGKWTVRAEPVQRHTKFW